MDENKELEEQMKMLEGMDLGEGLAAPFTPENPTNLGVVTNSTQPVQQVVQEQVNQQAQAQVVQTTSTTGFVPQQQVQNGPVQTVQSGPAQQAPVQQMTSQVADLNQQPVFVNLASSTYQTKTDFLTMKENEKTRVTLINMNFMRNHIHYIDGIGTFRCMSEYDERNQWPTRRAVCCKFPKKTDPTKFENAKNRLLVPVIEYPVMRADGKTLIQGAKPKLKMWNMNYVEEQALYAILKDYSPVADDYTKADLNTFDLSLTKVPKGGFTTISLVAVPSWKQQFMQDIQSEASKLNNEFYVTAFKESAKVIKEEVVQNYLNQVQQEQAMMNNMTQTQAPGAQDLGFNYTYNL